MVVLLVILAAALALAVIALVVQNGRLREHRAGHPYTEADVDRARKHSVATSHSVTSGKVQEHLAPLMPAFADRFNLREARFLGAPIDYVVFEGLEDGEVEQVTFVEVKTGRARLNKREGLIRKAVDAGRVSFEVLRLDQSESDTLPEWAAGAEEIEGVWGFDDQGRLVRTDEP